MSHRVTGRKDKMDMNKNNKTTNKTNGNEKGNGKNQKAGVLAPSNASKGDPLDHQERLVSKGVNSWNGSHWRKYLFLKNLLELMRSPPQSRAQ